MNPQELIKMAIEAQSYSYSPYSQFQVGAALLAKDGQTYTGCNIENAAYGPSNCAERTAIFKAISDGTRTFQGIAIVGNKKGQEGERDFCPPCGVCRQVMAEFCDLEEFQVILAKSVEEYRIFKLSELLPYAFL